MAASWLTLIGLTLDIIGFVVIGRELLKAPADRLFWSGTYRADLVGFALVIAGFAFQALAAIVQLI